MDCSFVLVALLICQVDGESDLTKVYRAVFDDYIKELRPAKNFSQSLNITFGFSLTQIIDVDEKNQILMTNAWLNLQWVDYRLAWDPELYANITKLHVPHYLIWRPDIVLYNNADSNYNSAMMSTDISISNTGNITWLSSVIFKSSCQMNVRYYPFDEQICTMKFASWAYEGILLDLALVSEKGDDTNYMASSEWDLGFIGAKKNLNYFSCCPDPTPDITVTIRIRRRPMFYVFNLILPCVLITGVALLGFYMPSDSGEKVTVGITTLLSMTVFLMVVAESMPPTSDALPLIGTYYGVTICLISFATSLTVFTLNIHHKGFRGNPVPHAVKRLVFGFLARIVRISVPPLDTVNPKKDYERCGFISEKQPLTNSAMSLRSNWSNGNLSPQFPRRVNCSSPVCPLVKENFETQFLRVLNKVYATIERNESRLSEQDRQEVIKTEWQQVALVVDRLLLLIFFTATTIVSLLIMYQEQLSIG